MLYNAQIWKIFQNFQVFKVRNRLHKKSDCLTPCIFQYFWNITMCKWLVNRLHLYEIWIKKNKLKVITFHHLSLNFEAPHYHNPISLQNNSSKNSLSFSLTLITYFLRNFIKASYFQTNVLHHIYSKKWKRQGYILKATIFGHVKIANNFIAKVKIHGLLPWEELNFSKVW